MEFWATVSKEKRKETIFTCCWSDFLWFSDQMEWVLLSWGPFKIGSDREEVMFWALPWCGCNWRHRRDSLSMMAMNVDAIYVFTWMQWYTSSRTFCPIKMYFDGHLRRMDAIM